MHRTDRVAPWLTLAVLVAAAIALRLILLELPEAGGDARSNWMSAHRLLHGGHGVLGLSYARLGIQIPTAAAILALGSHPLVYHVAPIAMSVLTVVGVFVLIRRHAGLTLAVVGGVTAIVFPAFDREAVQLLPGVFSAAALVWMLIALCRVAERPDAGWRLVALAVCVFFGYLVKFTDLFVLPGVVFALFAARVPRRNIALFLLGLVGLYGLEHAFFAAHGWPLGQGQMLLADTSVSSMAPEHRALWEVHGVGDFFRRYSADALGLDWTALYRQFTVSAIVILAVGRTPLKLCLAVVASHLLLNTFALQGLDPVLLLTRAVRRYNTIYAGAMIALVFAAIVEARRWLLGRAMPLRDHRVGRWLPLATHLIAAAIAVWFAVSAARELGARVDAGIDRWRSGTHALALTLRYRREVTGALAAGVPILSRWDERKAMTAVSAYYRPRADDWSGGAKEGIHSVSWRGGDYRMMSALSRSDAQAALDAIPDDAEVIWVERGDPFTLTRRRLGDISGAVSPPAPP